VPVAAGNVAVFVPATAGTETVTVPLVSPERTRELSVYPLISSIFTE